MKNIARLRRKKRKQPKIGAPMGGRVHWLLLCLRKEFKRSYKLRYDYEYHNYHFTRYGKRTPIDEFIVVRTSKKCFRVMYFNFRNTYFEYFSERTPFECAEHIEELFHKVKMAEERERH